MYNPPSPNKDRYNLKQVSLVDQACLHVKRLAEYARHAILSCNSSFYGSSRSLHHLQVVKQGHIMQHSLVNKWGRHGEYITLILDIASHLPAPPLTCPSTLSQQYVQHSNTHLYMQQQGLSIMYYAGIIHLSSHRSTNTHNKSHSTLLNPIYCRPYLQNGTTTMETSQIYQAQLE